MTLKTECESLSVFEQIKPGLEQGIAHARGELNLRTTMLPLPPPPASPKRVAALRRKLRVSQSVFAATLNVSPTLVQSWEQGSRRPGRGALRLLEIIEKRAQLVGELFAEPRSRPGRNAAAKAPALARTARSLDSDRLYPPENCDGKVRDGDPFVWDG
jgi:putative transcriptional regulator